MKPKVSIVIPIHDMKGGDKFLWQTINRIMDQSFTDYEIVIVREGKMARNTNAGMLRAWGDLIKILYLDDCLSDIDSLEKMVNSFKPEYAWMMVGTNNNPNPRWTDDIEKGNNKLGSPSALLVRSDTVPLVQFDEEMSWLLDCDYYKRLAGIFGKPQILPGNFVTIGVGDHQMTHLLTDEDKRREEDYMKNKYENN